jgi:uncharacterized protein
MSTDQIIRKTEEYVRSELSQAEGGHDWWHIHRVRNNALKIAETEPGDRFVIELASLLHDIADAKFHDGDDEIGPRKTEAFLLTQSVPSPVVEHVCRIVENISFKGGHVYKEFDSPELRIVQDADRLDAIGAIGIARTFNYGGYCGRLLYDPGIKPDLQMTKEAYRKSTSPTINHFYEKLLLLKDRMNTSTGREMAEQRHRFMQQYLDQFYREWEGGG